MTGPHREPPTSGRRETDFLFRLQDKAGVLSKDLGAAAGIAPQLITMMRHGSLKRLVNPTAERLAKHFGYRFALIPDCCPAIIKRPEHESIE